MIVEIDRKIAEHLQYVMTTNNREVCFLLGGFTSAKGYRINEAIRLFNRARSKFFFIIDETNFKIGLNNLKLDTVGFFHSHLKNNELSDYDIHSMKTKNVVWVIAHFDKTCKVIFTSYICAYNGLKKIKTVLI